MPHRLVPEHMMKMKVALNALLLCFPFVPLYLQAPLLAQEYRRRGLSRPKCLLTIHNIAFQVGFVVLVLGALFCRYCAWIVAVV